MAHVFVACPKCGAGYKIAKDHLTTEAVCRSCGHRWIPAEARAAEPKAPAGEGAPASSDETGASPPAEAEPAAPSKPAPHANPAAKQAAGGGSDARLSALEAMARAAGGGKAAKTPKPPAARKPPKGKAARTGAKAEAPPPDSDPLIGEQINGFKVQTRLGTGGFGIVYRAFDTNLERSVAIKMLPANLAKAGKGVVERFLREARSAAKLAHPNIVTIHQICPYKNTYYIVMELIDDGALHEVLGKQRPLTPEEATRIVRAAAEGLGHAHTRGIIHRDIKPGNIMLTSDGQVKVSDFGLARDVLQGQDIVGAGHSLGTPRYMAPEQALGEEPTAASDLYSLAATYFVLLTGQAPFDGTDEREIMKKQVQAPVPDPRNFRPELPAAAFRFFEKAMAKEPADRYCVAQEFIEALDRLDFARADSDLTDSQDLVDQLSSVAGTDRGSHLSQTLGRAVKRAQRQRTPMSESAVDEVLGAGTAVGRKAGWKLWLLIGVLALLVVGGAVAAAILLAPGNGAETGQPGAGTETAGTPAGQPGPTEKPPEETGGEAPAETPTGKPPEEKPPAEEPPTSPLEDVAQEVLKEVQAYESDPDTPVYRLINMYKENVIGVYPGTKAAEEARRAIERLEKGKRLQDTGGKDEGEEAPPADPKPAEESAADGA